MSLELAQIVSGWPLAASFAVAATAGGLRAGRRRTALNEALHELRRPLQALALAAPGEAAPAPALDGPLEMAAVALERLDREINGDSVASLRAPLRVRPLLEGVVGRWRGRAELAGGSLALGWFAGDAVVEGDRSGIAQALDNLVVNAIEHGGPEVVVEASVEAGRLRLAVLDPGRAPGPGTRRGPRPGLLARLAGQGRRGHGLRVVRRVAAAHGGEFHLLRSVAGTEAVLGLPLAGAGEAG